MKQNISLLVGFAPQTTEGQKKQLHNKVGGRLITKFKEINVEVVEVKKVNLEDVIEAYQSSHHVAFTEENSTYCKDFIPNHSLNEKASYHSNDRYKNQWGLKRVGLKPAWCAAASKMKRKVTIAILDTGIDPNHPALSSKIVKPVNFTTKYRRHYQDKNGHGTHVAGIAAAVTNNLIDESGSKVSAGKIMPIKVVSSDGGKTKWIIAGILYAVQNGAKVINISIGGTHFSKALQRAIDYAWMKGVIIVAAAGNEGNERVHYPAGYNFVLAVSATNEANDLAKFSNSGMNIGIAAPGTPILSTTPTYPISTRLPFYDVAHGTSQATPFVSGVVALMFAIYPDLSNADVIQLIQRAADPVEEETKQWNSFFGYGLLNAANAVNRKTGKTIRRSNPNLGKQIPENNTQVCKGSFYGQIVDRSGNPIANAIVSARIAKKIVSLYKTKNNVLTENRGLNTDGMFRLQNLLPGKYQLFVELPGRKAIQIDTYSIVGGADTILQIVCET